VEREASRFRREWVEREGVDREEEEVEREGLERESVDSEGVDREALVRERGLDLLLGVSGSLSSELDWDWQLVEREREEVEREGLLRDAVGVEREKVDREELEREETELCVMDGIDTEGATDWGEREGGVERERSLDVERGVDRGWLDK
jgi:hypothetical protein